MKDSLIAKLARECGFELAGVTPAIPASDHDRYRHWVANGYAAEMSYLIDRRAAVRETPLNLLPSARSIICVGKLYNSPMPYSTRFREPELAWISRYAWGDDYHDILRQGLQQLANRLLESGRFEYRICVDTAPLLERSYARLAGLGWIGKNTVPDQSTGWLLVLFGRTFASLELEPDSPPPDRCGSCRRCIDACPTAAIVPDGEAYALDARLCISYFTIELRGAVPAEYRDKIGNHVFGCDICQDVCPWNRRACSTDDPGFAAAHFAPPLEELAELNEEEFREMFRRSPVYRAKYTGFLRNVAVAMGNARDEKFRRPLEKLAQSPERQVATRSLGARSTKLKIDAADRDRDRLRVSPLESVRLRPGSFL